MKEADIYTKKWKKKGCIAPLLDYPFFLLYFFFKNLIDPINLYHWATERRKIYNLMINYLYFKGGII